MATTDTDRLRELVDQLQTIARRDAAARDFIDCVITRKRARWHKVPMIEFERLCAAYGVTPPPREAL